jgi:hypothetical protein
MEVQEKLPQQAISKTKMASRQRNELKSKNNRFGCPTGAKFLRRPANESAQLKRNCSDTNYPDVTHFYNLSCDW